MAWIAALASFLLACSGDEPTRTGTAELPAGRPGLGTPDQVVENGEHVITAQGVKKAVLVAEQLYFYNDQGKVYGDTIQVSFFDDAGAFQSMLTAEEGEMSQHSDDMIARGNVVVRGSGSRITTDELHYDPQRNLVTSDKPTEIFQAGNVIRGSGVESDPALTNIRIRGGSAVIRSEPELGRQRQPQEAERPGQEPRTQEADTSGAATP
ncbi:MAG TPA: LPS export ABC transporter periplasmic protein LptC [Gemmatimonadota bacterium]|nr:LPS export ABC transporter periplasmic protein LptC [Gemmatimonadota bacterium]